jgi:ketosteroid isomerase-like protein
VSRERVEQILAGFRAFNEGRPEEALEGLPDDIEWLVPAELPDPGPFIGREGILRFWSMWRETFSEFEVEIDEVIDAEEHVIVMIRVHGRGRDSGAEVSTPSFPQVWTWRGDQISRVEMLPSRQAALDSIGLPATTPGVPQDEFQI